MAIVQVKDLIEAGVHFGHRASRWNPKMRPYIYGKRNLIHIIDLRETVRGLLRADRYLTKIVSNGSLVLFVGTKRQAKEAIEREATRCGMPYVNERWLGGTLTNYRTIRDRLKRLAELEALWLPAGENPAKVDLDAYIRTMFNETGKLDLTRAPETAPIRRYSKKMVAALNRELLKIRRNLQGIREMNRLPDALIVVDPKREHIAVKEAQRMGVAVVALIDTDSDPDLVDLPIPGNDDSIRSIELILSRLADAVLAGKAALPSEPSGPGAPRPRPPVAPAATAGNGPNAPAPPPNPKPASAVVD
ncbi:MAG TPA: 30S ribosomal protein S2 [Gemmataceae bacterium]|nr:30S ribosomal protein S2 [Gemmataceae bacterium]